MSSHEHWPPPPPPPVPQEHPEQQQWDSFEEEDERPKRRKSSKLGRAAYLALALLAQNPKLVDRMVDYGASRLFDRDKQTEAYQGGGRSEGGGVRPEWRQEIMEKDRGTGAAYNEGYIRGMTDVFGRAKKIMATEHLDAITSDRLKVETEELFAEFADADSTVSQSIVDTSLKILPMGVSMNSDLFLKEIAEDGYERGANMARKVMAAFENNGELNSAGATITITNPEETREFLLGPETDDPAILRSRIAFVVRTMSNNPELTTKGTN